MGATTRRADKEALKSFITRRKVTVRLPYGHHDISVPAMASLIGTVNDEAGFLSDPTGSRRFLTCHLDEIDWGYSKTVDRQQLWLEAYQAFLNGEKWTLTSDEAKQASTINARYEVDDAVEGILKRHYQIDPTRDDWWVPTHVILERLYGPRNAHTRSNTYNLGGCCRRLGLTRIRRSIRGQDVWGFTGLRQQTRRKSP